MRKFNLCAITFAALAMIACNNEGLDSSNIHQEGELNGEKTYAVFNVAVNTTPGTMSSTDANGGLEHAVESEALIENAGIYVFSYVSDAVGTSEVMTYVDALNATTGSKLPSRPVLITSGKKHIVVVANMTAAVKTALDAAFDAANNAAGYTNFTGVVASQSTDNPINSFIINPTAAGLLRITMTGETDAVLKAGVTETEAQDTNNENHIPIYVDRNVAKLDVKMVDGGAIVSKKKVEASIFGALPVQVGDLSGMKYAVRNMNKSQYVMKNIRGTFVNSPFSSFTDESSWADATLVYADRMFPTVEAGTLGTYSFKPLAAVGNETGTNYLDYVAYMTENTNEVARISNSTYAALSARYMPEVGYYVKGFENDAANSNVVKLVPALDAMVDGYSLFNYEYNLSFESTTLANAASMGNIKTIAAYHTSKIEPALSDISATSIKFVKGGMITATGTDVIDVPNYDDDKAITDPVNTAAILAMYNAASSTYTEPLLFVHVSKTLNTDSNLEQLQMTAVYVSNLSNNWEINGGVNFGTLTAGVYETTAAGLQCYYRVNIYDPALGATHQMRNSVVRNQSYHLSISKINKIGYPTDFDVTIEPSEPLNNNTFVQATITVNKWISKEMDTELDM